MEDEVNGGKELTTLYSGSFPYGSSIKGALCLSKDAQLCMITGNGVHILRPKSAFPDFSASLKFSIGLLKNPGNENHYDVGIDTDRFCLQPPEFEESYTLILDRSLNPNRINLNPPYYVEAAWSPDICYSNGSCILAILSSGNRVYTVKKDIHTNNYVIISDITQSLYENFKSNDFKDANVVTLESYAPESQLSAEFFEYSRRQYYLAITGIHWCPCKFIYSAHDGLGHQERDIRDNFALLGGCNKLGMLLIWKVGGDVFTDTLHIEHLTSIAVSNQQATTIAWYQDSASSAGYIAIAFSNGFITVCVIETLISKEASAITELQKVDIWMEDDLMEVRFLHWLKKDDCLYLIATKESNIIVFKTELDNSGNILSHLCSTFTALHEAPIVGLCCRDGYVLTTGMDGSTRYWQIGHEDSVEIKAITKPGYASFGMQLSNDGLILFRVLFPTSIIYVQGKEAEKIKLVATAFKPLEKIVQRVNDDTASTDFEWYEVCRVLANQTELHPPILSACAFAPVGESTSIAQLQKITFVKWLIQKRKTKARAQLECSVDSPDFRPILIRNVLERVKFTIEFLNTNGEMDSNSRKLALLAADWLVFHGNSIDICNAIKIYDLLTDSESKKQADVIKSHRFESNSSDGVIAKNTDPLTLRLPAREYCPLCKNPIFLEEEGNGWCNRGHIWKRCSLTLSILTDLTYRKCVYCRRAASSKSADISWTSFIYRKFVNVNKCCLCNSRLLMYG